LLSDSSNSFIEIKDKMMAKLREMSNEILTAYRPKGKSNYKNGGSLFDFQGNDLIGNSTECSLKEKRSFKRMLSKDSI